MPSRDRPSAASAGGRSIPARHLSPGRGGASRRTPADGARVALALLARTLIAGHLERVAPGLRARIGARLERHVRTGPQGHEEQEQPETDHDAHEGIERPRTAGEDDAEHAEDAADAVDEQHGAAMVEAEVEQPVVDVATVGL